jgi:hypothetical protein
VLLGKPLCLLRVNIHYGDKPALGQLAIDLGVDCAHLARANDSSAYLCIFHLYMPPPLFCFCSPPIA